MLSDVSMALPFSQACENNKDAIFEHLQPLLSRSLAVLEIASGTGQHASYFAAGMSHINWQPTELADNITILQPRCESYAGVNLRPPAILDVCERPWRLSIPDVVFTANSLHIMPFEAVQQLFSELGRAAAQGTQLVVYGPFNYGGQYTSDSNAGFDQWLLQQHPMSAIRDFEKVDELALGAGFALQHDFEMPANNRLLMWHKNH
jgi:hypothetical protein